MDEQGGPGLSHRMIVLVTDARAQWAELDRRIAAFDAEFVRWTKENEDARRLATVPGVGATIASALIAAIGGTTRLAPRRTLTWTKREHSRRSAYLGRLGSCLG
jgi:transposase